MTHSQLRMIFLQGSVSAIVQAVFNAPVLSNQFQEAFGSRRGGGQTRDPIRNLLLHFSQSIDALPLHLEDLRETRPLGIMRQLATNSDLSFFSPSMPFVHGGSGAKIHGRGRPARAHRWWLKEGLQILIHLLLILL